MVEKTCDLLIKGFPVRLKRDVKKLAADRYTTFKEQIFAILEMECVISGMEPLDPEEKENKRWGKK